MKTNKKFFQVKTLTLTALLMVFGFGLFANGIQGKDESKARKKNRNNTTALSADKIALYKSVEDFYQKNYTDVVNETVTTEKITKVVVYDMAGNILQEQNANTTKIDLAKLPAHAKLLMKENSTHFYIVMN